MITRRLRSPRKTFNAIKKHIMGNEMPLRLRNDQNTRPHISLVFEWGWNFGQRFLNETAVTSRILSFCPAFARTTDRPRARKPSKSLIKTILSDKLAGRDDYTELRRPRRFKKLTFGDFGVSPFPFCRSSRGGSDAEMSPVQCVLWVFYR